MENKTMKSTLTRDVTREECPWLDNDLKAGDEIYLYLGHTYGCISPNGRAYSFEENKGPFFEIPINAVIQSCC